MAKVTIIMPVSRLDYLKRIFAQLEMMHCDAENTNLLCYVDGDMELFLKTRDWVERSRFKEKLTVFRKKGIPDVSNVRRRRKRIATIHNEIKGMIGTCDYIFLIEDDTLFPLNALEKLLHQYTLNPYAGFIAGVQVGRWGFTVPGIWKVNNPYNPTEFTSQLPPKQTTPLETLPTEQIDASGLYCMLTKRDHYLSCDFDVIEDILGPDVFYGLHLRKQGYNNFVDWSINTGHLTKRGEIRPSNTELQQICIKRKNEKEWQVIQL